MSNSFTQRTLSKKARDYFLSEEVFASYERLVSAAGLKQEDSVPALSTLVHRFVTGMDTLADLRRNMEMTFLLSSSQASEMLSAIILQIMTPIVQEIPEVAKELADEKEIAQARIQAEQLKSEPRADVVQQEKDQILEKKQRLREERKALEEKEVQILTKRYVQTTGRVPTEHVVPVAPPLSRTSVALSAHMQIQQQQAKIDTEKVRAAVQQTAVAKPSMTTRKPRMQDIATMPRLAGPFEELQSLNLISFRRLAKDPEQTIHRIKDMVNLLDDQGYEKRVAGIRAFQSSPIMRAYGQITQKALIFGKSVADVLVEDPEAMSMKEYQALMKLNAELRF